MPTVRSRVRKAFSPSSRQPLARNCSVAQAVQIQHLRAARTFRQPDVCLGRLDAIPGVRQRVGALALQGSFL